MPDGPMPQQPAPGGAPQDQASGGGGGGGGGFAAAITQTDAAVAKIAGAVTQNGQMPDAVKQAFSDALSAWRNAVSGLMQAVGGGGGPQPGGGAEAGAPVTPEQGGSGGAVPMSHQPMRG